MQKTSAKQAVLKLVNGSVPLTYLAYFADNMLASAKVSRADPAPDEHLSGVNVEADVAHAERVAGDYLKDGPLGKKVAEVGPGGSAAIALLLLAQGSESVDLVDRFDFRHEAGQQRRVHRHIIDRHPRLREMFGETDGLDGHVRWHVGEDAAAEIFFRRHEGYDAIVSNAVLEHLFDPLAALEAMAAALAPGGRMVHVVDLRDHGMFTAAGHDELTFLTVPGWFYPHMSKRRGRPNRVLIDRYAETMERIGLDFRLNVLNLVGVGPVDPAPYEQLPNDVREKAEAHVERMRPSLAVEFRSRPTRDLVVSAFRLTAEKTA